MRSSCSSRWVLSFCSFPCLGFVLVLAPDALASSGLDAVVFGFLFRRVGAGAAAGVCVIVDVGVGVDVGKEVAVETSFCSFEGVFWGCACPASGISGIGLEKRSFHSLSSAPSSSVSWVASSSRTICICLRSCLSRVISACASWRWSRDLSWGRERSS